jgi:ribosomal protein S18 acetylase RimI-like enzyme
MEKPNLNELSIKIDSTLKFIELINEEKIQSYKYYVPIEERNRQIRVRFDIATETVILQRIYTQSEKLKDTEFNNNFIALRKLFLYKEKVEHETKIENEYKLNDISFTKYLKEIKKLFDSRKNELNVMIYYKPYYKNEEEKRSLYQIIINNYINSFTRIEQEFLSEFFVTQKIENIELKSKLCIDNIVFNRKSFDEKFIFNFNVYCVLEKEKLIGFLSIADKINKEETTIINDSYLSLIIVNKNYENKGIGRWLIEKIINDIENENTKKDEFEKIKYIRLNTNTIKNKVIFDLYIKCGFKITQENHGGHENMVEMIYLLKNINEKN